MAWKHETGSIVYQVYHVVRTALWTLAVAVAIHLLSHIPEMQDALAKAEARRTQEVMDENSRYCEKWGMRVGSHEHVICTMDLQDLREKIAREIADSNVF